MKKLVLELFKAQYKVLQKMIENNSISSAAFPIRLSQAQDQIKINVVFSSLTVMG